MQADRLLRDGAMDFAVAIKTFGTVPQTQGRLRKKRKAQAKNAKALRASEATATYQWSRANHRSLATMCDMPSRMPGSFDR